MMTGATRMPPLAVSNIAWGADNLPGFLGLLQRCGCEGVEFAPSLLWEATWPPSRTDITEIEAALARWDLKPVAFHSLFFGEASANLFGPQEDRARHVAHLEYLAHMAAQLSVPFLVWGSPKARSRGSLSAEEAWAIAVDALSALGPRLEESGVVLALEPLPPGETDFLASVAEAARLVAEIGSPSIRLHLDIKAMAEMEGDICETIERYGAEAVHCHVADPGLTPPGSTGLDHGRIGAALEKSGYAGFLSLEMRRDFGPPEAVIESSLAYLDSCYRAAP